MTTESPQAAPSTPAPETPADPAEGAAAGQRDEEWRPVPGYEGRYEVSSLGRVRSLRFVNHTADILRKTPRIISTKLRSGYPSLKLCINGTEKTVTMHSLVLAAFVGPRPPGMEAGHLNGNRTDNRAENLAWITRPENGLQRSQHGNRGERLYNAQLTAALVRRIRELQAAGMRAPTIAKKLGISKWATEKVVAGKSWRHVL